MFITKVTELCKCKSFADGERCRFFRLMPPLEPGHVPDPKNPGFLPGGETEEVFPPDRLANLKKGAHYVFTLEGEDLVENEVAVMGVIEVGKEKTRVPYAWLPQSEGVDGRTSWFQGKKALERVGILTDESERALRDPTQAIHQLGDAVNVFCEVYPEVKVFFGTDDGTGFIYSTNDGRMADYWEQYQTAAEEAASLGNDN